MNEITLTMDRFMELIEAEKELFEIKQQTKKQIEGDKLTK